MTRRPTYPVPREMKRNRWWNLHSDLWMVYFFIQIATIMISYTDRRVFFFFLHKSHFDTGASLGHAEFRMAYGFGVRCPVRKKMMVAVCVFWEDRISIWEWIFLSFSIFFTLLATKKLCISRFQRKLVYPELVFGFGTIFREENCTKNQKSTDLYGKCTFGQKISFIPSLR